MEFLIPPFKHQLDALELSKKTDCLGLYWEMGTGKSKGLVEILRHRYKTSRRLMRTLILTPSATIYNWEDEILKNSKIKKPDIVLLNQKSSTAKRKVFERWCSQHDELVQNKIVITNYETLLNQPMLDALLEWKPEILGCDEVHNCKNRTAKRTKAVIKLSSQAQYRYILTGTPILKNVEDLFSQFLILDRGQTFGKNFNIFRAKYMRDANAAWSNNTNYFPKWEAKPETYEELTYALRRKTLRITKEECLDLPPFMVKDILVDISPEMAKHYRELSNDLITYVEKLDKGGKYSKAVTANLAVVKALRLQQIVSGFVKTEDGDIITLKSNPKGLVCKDLLEQLTPDHKVIVWCSFKQNYRMLEAICKEIGVEYRLITGDQTAEQKRESEVSFQTNPDVRVLVANRSAGGVGINLTAASYSIVYSRNFSLGEELQSDARNYRKGSEQHEKITKINLVCKGTIDELVMESLRNKKDISNRVIDFVKENLGG